MLAAGADVASRGQYGKTPLHIVVEQFSPPPEDDYLEVMEILIRAGADVNALDYSSNSPLHLAAASVSGNPVISLLRHGALVDLPDSNRSPLYYALDVHRELANLTKLLHERNNTTNVLKALLQWGADPNPPEYYSDTVLTLAVRWKLDDTIHLLLGSGADLPKAIQLLNKGNIFMNTIEAKYLLNIVKHRKKGSSSESETCS